MQGDAEIHTLSSKGYTFLSEPGSLLLRRIARRFNHAPGTDNPMPWQTIEVFSAE
jgi:hypothetical protein